MLVDQRRSRSGLHRVTVLGSFSVTAHGDPVPLEADARRVVAYLAVHRRPQRRTALAADLWPGVPAAAAAALLDESLAGRRRPLADDAGASTARSRSTPPSSVDLDEAMTLVRALAIVPGHPDTVPADLPAATALLERGRPARLDRRLARRRARALPPDPAQRARGAQLRADRRRPVRRRRHHGPGGRAHRPQPGERPPRADRGAPRAGRDRRGRRRVRRVPGAAAQQRRRPPPPGSTAAFGLDGLLPPVPAWPVLRVRRPAERVPVAAPGLRIAAQPRRLVSGGPRPAPSASPSQSRPGPSARCRRSGVRVRGVHARNVRTRHRARPAPRPCP